MRHLAQHPAELADGRGELLGSADRPDLVRHAGADEPERSQSAPPAVEREHRDRPAVAAHAAEHGLAPGAEVAPPRVRQLPGQEDVARLLGEAAPVVAQRLELGRPLAHRRLLCPP
jgi:hypothetical protein